MNKNETLLAAVSSLDALAMLQQDKMLNIAKSIYPNIVQDDLWQPFDFPLLEESVYFRHEEGIREGILSAKSALLALKNEITELCCDTEVSV